MKTLQSHSKIYPLGLVILALIGLLWLAIRLVQNPAISEKSNDAAKDSASQVATIRPMTPQVKSELEYEIVTLLPRDAIPAIDHPEFYKVSDADSEYAPDELVIGISINGESRAYSTELLDYHEVVNDTVGGQKIVVTW